ncbi:hypothetical protein D3C72_2217500 [compost metagenome]
MLGAERGRTTFLQLVTVPGYISVRGGQFGVTPVALDRGDFLRSQRWRFNQHRVTVGILPNDFPLRLPVE